MTSSREASPRGCYPPEATLSREGSLRGCYPIQGHLDRPRRGAVRACRPDPADYTPDDWRAALLAVLTPTPTDQAAALRAAADWARDTCGLAFERLRSDGHILTALRAAVTSALRRGEIERHGADRIARAADPLPKGQLSFADLSSTGREEPR